MELAIPGRLAWGQRHRVVGSIADKMLNAHAKKR